MGTLAGEDKRDLAGFAPSHIEGESIVPDGPALLNALHGISRDQLQRDVRQFVAAHHLEEHEDVFFRGALAAQHPVHFNEIEGLSHDDKSALAYEQAHKWHHPFALYFAGTCFRKTPNPSDSQGSICLCNRRGHPRMGSNGFKRCQQVYFSCHRANLTHRLVVPSGIWHRYSHHTARRCCR